MAKKGHTNNPNGRPKGKENKITTELKDWIKNLLEANTSQLEQDLKDLEPHQRWQVVSKLLDFTIPKMRNIDANINYENLTEEQLDQIINRLSEEIK
ncbi:hypothetical protein [Plebeiibacterium sediminum]|uniref:DUF5681 domain-containing protein n=1 Tax=Plebeiibacterium sediminum TaxID=2992112 RepID=A0AAE3M546_9BACT|nr:hypothetical protein [Plebeiobacterium sediminum]MCW3786835.1 hypothetical protein [Plebeiobacterium sediminum]